MRKALCFIWACSLFSGPVSGIPLKRGTPVLVRLTTSASSNRDSQVSAEVADDVVLGGDPVVMRGTPVQLSVNRRKSRGVGKPGYLQLGCLSTRSVDGQHILLSGTIEQEGYSRQGAAIGLGVSMGLLFTPLGFLFLCLKGERVELPVGTTIFNVTVTDNYEIQP